MRVGRRTSAVGADDCCEAAVRHFLARNLGLAHALVAVLALVGAGLAAASAWRAEESRASLSPGLHELAEEAIACHLAAIGYLVASVAFQWQLARCWRAGEISPTALQTVSVFVQGSVALGGVAVVLRGAVSRAWLAGLGPVLPITVTVAVLAVALSLAGRWLCQDSGPVPREPDASAMRLRWLRVLLVVAAIVWLVALAWLEARPLPYPGLPGPATLAGIQCLAAPISVLLTSLSEGSRSWL